jgi:hypothetical protein
MFMPLVAEAAGTVPRRTTAASGVKRLKKRAVMVVSVVWFWMR